jgi:hypothetical protein
MHSGAPGGGGGGGGVLPTFKSKAEREKEKAEERETQRQAEVERVKRQEEERRAFEEAARREKDSKRSREAEKRQEERARELERVEGIGETRQEVEVMKKTKLMGGDAAEKRAIIKPEKLAQEGFRYDPKCDVSVSNSILTSLRVRASSLPACLVEFVCFSCCVSPIG